MPAATTTVIAAIFGGNGCGDKQYREKQEDGRARHASVLHG
jgi:hypothetical protein